MRLSKPQTALVVLAMPAADGSELTWSDVHKRARKMEKHKARRFIEKWRQRKVRRGVLVPRACAFADEQL